MKREEIIAKWAGMTVRERDAWVAEVVFGHCVYYFPKPEIKRECPDGNKGCLTFHGRGLPKYTTETYAAWEVFERFPYAEVARIPGPVPTYGVRINDPDDGSIRAMTKELTFPEAICLAALIAKLTEVSADGAA